MSLESNTKTFYFGTQYFWTRKHQSKFLRAFVGCLIQWIFSSVTGEALWKTKCSRTWAFHFPKCPIFLLLLIFLVTLGYHGKKMKSKNYVRGCPMLINTLKEVRHILISLISGMAHSKHIIYLTHFYYFQQTTSYLWCGFLIVVLFFNLLYFKISFHVYFLVNEEIT